MQTQSQSKKIRILLVDDHIVLRMGLTTATNGEPDMEVVADADNGLQAIVAYRAYRPDVVVLDLRMHGMNGVDTIRLLREEFRKTPACSFSATTRAVMKCSRP